VRPDILTQTPQISRVPHNEMLSSTGLTSHIGWGTIDARST
jgi:hypothetical protein